MLSMAMVLWLSSVFYLLGWLPPKPFHSFLTHGGGNSQVPARRQLSELAATFNSKGQSGRGGRVRSVRG